MGTRDLGALLLLGALWGGSFVFIRVAAPVLRPFVLMELRVMLAAVALTLCAAAVSRLPKLRFRWKEFLVLGTLNAAIPFTLIAASEINLTASLAAILNSTTPLFTAMVAAAWIKDGLTARRIVGLALGVVGVAVLVGWNPIPLSGVVALSIGASLAAALSYGLSAVYTKRTFAGVPPLTLAIGQQAWAAVILMPPAAVGFPEKLPSLAVILSVLALSLLSTAIAHLLYFRLIASVGPTKTSTVTFLVPVFGVLWGFVLLGEPITLSMLAGLGIILSSVTLVTRIGFVGAEKGVEHERGDGKS